MAIKERYSEYQYTKMPYGKYKGFFIKDIPDKYIEWCIVNYEDKGMAQMMAIELQRRNPKWRKI